jgi:hypothetical protein
VRRRLLCAGDVPHLHSIDHERVGDERAMTAPRNRLGAHDGEPFRGSEPLERGQGVAERVGLHVVGIAAE